MTRFKPAHLTESALMTQKAGFEVILPVNTESFYFRNIKSGIVYVFKFVGDYVCIEEKDSKKILWGGGSFENSRRSIEAVLEELGHTGTRFVIDTLKKELEGRYDVSSILVKASDEYEIRASRNGKQFTIIHNSTKDVLDISIAELGSLTEHTVGTFELPKEDKNDFIKSIVAAMNIYEMFRFQRLA